MRTSIVTRSLVCLWKKGDSAGSDLNFNLSYRELAVLSTVGRVTFDVPDLSRPIS